MQPMSTLRGNTTTTIRKRDGRCEAFDRRKVDSNLTKLSWGLDSKFVSVPEIVEKLVYRLPNDTMDAEVFQIFLAEIVSTFSTQHPDYSILAGRVYTCYIHKRVPKRFSAWVLEHATRSPPLFSSSLVNTVKQHFETLDAAIIHHRDFDFSYRAMRMFERSFLLRTTRSADERVQFMYMRVAIGIHADDIESVLETYELLSTRKFSLAPSILWNGGLVKRNFASSYILQPHTLNARDAVSDCADLSVLWAADGGVGIHVGDVPATRSGSRDKHPGLMPLLGVYDSFAAYWSNPNRNRITSATAYLPIWHADVKKFVLSRTNRASDGQRLRHVFPALWIPDLFMRRLEARQDWSLFDPVDVPTLTGLAGDAFINEYESFERDGLAISTLPARTLWDSVCAALRESGSPFLLHSDNINRRNNQQHLGTVKAGGLCTEIVQHSSYMETAVCTLGSLCLPKYLRADGVLDYAELHRVTKVLVRTLDRVIDRADFLTNGTEISTFGTRSLAIGVQGLADVFAMVELPFTSVEARAINVRVFETIYHAGLLCSSELAEVNGTYASWPQSPASQGVLQVDMWGATTSDRHDFDTLRARISRFGLRNSTLTAQMPTTSTAILLGNSEGVEPYTSNVVQFRVMSGNSYEINRSLVSALQKRGLWSRDMQDAILGANGSIQDLDSVPDDLKAVFRTAFELDPQDIIDMAVDRSPYIDQSQSTTLFLAQPTPAAITRLQLHAWRSGLKTGAYYVRSQSHSDPQSFGVNRSSLKATASSPQIATASSFEAAAFPTED